MFTYTHLPTNVFTHTNKQTNKQTNINVHSMAQNDTLLVVLS